MGKNLSNSDILKKLGKNVRKIRLLKNLTQQDLADGLDKSVKFISLIENGATGISIQSLVDLCLTLNCDVNSLFEDIVPFDDNTSVNSSIKFFNNKDKEIVDTLIKYIADSKK